MSAFCTRLTNEKEEYMGETTDNIIISSHAVQRLGERMDMKKPTVDVYKLMESKRLTLNRELSTRFRAIYDHTNDNGVLTRYVFNADSSVLLTVFTRGRKKLHITERELKAKSLVLTPDELAEQIETIVPEITKKQLVKLTELFDNQRNATAHTFTTTIANSRTNHTRSN